MVSTILRYRRPRLPHPLLTPHTQARLNPCSSAARLLCACVPLPRPPPFRAKPFLLFFLAACPSSLCGGSALAFARTPASIYCTCKIALAVLRRRPCAASSQCNVLEPSIAAETVPAADTGPARLASAYCAHSTKQRTDLASRSLFVVQSRPISIGSQRPKMPTDGRFDGARFQGS